MILVIGLTAMNYQVILVSRGRKKKDFFDNLFGNQNDLGSGSMDFPSFDMDISGMDVSDIGNINDGMPRVSTRTPTIPTAKRPKTSQITSFDFMQNKNFVLLFYLINETRVFFLMF